MSKDPFYSDRLKDDVYEYREKLRMSTFHFCDLKQINNTKDRLMTEDEWRKLGVQQSVGWEHFDIFKPEPNVLLFRRKRNDV
ncbi:cyclin-dependent kinase regulatory subunit, putative [Entamoeba invadens IP1]|uniref:cyclin-dependent kinase regulatory subunit, putative n=1 Tax=Entamoeba invadens IP1 TaxID=370355 RepID=UPI0002C3D3A2|nr:cyclin-dependent kinase regulatory subunit, putative [Entamoeba invadens IP1]ELP85137.1 cyclin-dependent kinase regulatory subunit, putative [Entamoeba invadens IP1]|eukprot:XP_004184483.1 cyclin-dependent kinase regulatory subunit, putative [Entamoeba invadens IP1]